MIKKPNRFRYIWTIKNTNFFKSKLFFNPHTQTNFFKKKKYINKIIKIKRLTGLFKRKVNFRMTFLKKRSFLFKKVSGYKDNFKKNKFKISRYFKKKYNYRVFNINVHKNRRSIFFENREIIKLFLKNKFIKRQNKLNSYLVSLLGKNSRNLLNCFEYKLSTVLIKSHFFNNLDDSVFFIKNGFVFVGVIAIHNPNYIVKLKDNIKLVFKQHYYIFYKNSLNDSIFALKKLNWAFYKFRKKNRFTKLLPKVYNWINSNKLFGFDIPYYLEVDYVNLNIFILLKPFDFAGVDYVNLKYVNFYLTRLYNWSYIV